MKLKNTRVDKSQKVRKSRLLKTRQKRRKLGSIRESTTSKDTLAKPSAPKKLKTSAQSSKAKITMEPMRYLRAISFTLLSICLRFQED